jgi:hypothetical protein
MAMTYHPIILVCVLVRESKPVLLEEENLLIPCEHLIDRVSHRHARTTKGRLHQRTAAMGIVLLNVELKSALSSGLGSTYGITGFPGVS